MAVSHYCNWTYIWDRPDRHDRFEAEVLAVSHYSNWAYMWHMSDRHNRFETGPVITPHRIVNKALTGFVAGGQTHDENSGAAPGLEVNYGVLPDVQLHIIMPMAYGQISGEALYYGYGDTELGVKHRFINPGKDDWWPQVGVFPLLEVPTGDASKGLGATGERVSS